MRPRIVYTDDYTILYKRCARALKLPPSRQGNKDIKMFVKIAKLFNKKSKDARRTKHIEQLEKLIPVRDKEVSNNYWMERQVAALRIECDDVEPLRKISKMVIEHGVEIPGFTVLPTNKANINATVVPLVDFKNKHKNLTLCVYKSYIEGEEGLKDFYERSCKEAENEQERRKGADEEDDSQ